MPANLYFISGAQCTGKTAVINELKCRGYSVIPEVAREIASKDRRFFGDGISLNRKLFQDEIFRMQKIFFEDINSDGKPIFSDRGFGDTLAYYRAFGLEIPKENTNYVRQFCDSRVFILEPLELYEKDAIRAESLSEQENIQREIFKTYEEIGNEIVFVPRMSVEKRAEFILKKTK